MDCDIASYHIDSFNYLLDVGVQEAAIDIPPVKAKIGDDIIEYSYAATTFGRPSLLKGVRFFTLIKLNVVLSNFRSKITFLILNYIRQNVVNVH